MQHKISRAECVGRAHAAEGVPCQDRTAEFRSGETVCCALSDGAGSRPLSHIGAECVTRYVARELAERFDFYYNSDESELKERLLEGALEALHQTGHAPEALACTLLFCASHSDGRRLTGHIGDGVMVLESRGRLSVFSAPENGSYRNETYFVTDSDAHAHLRVRRGVWSDEGTLLLMSDGTADSLYVYGRGEPAPACATLASWLRDGDESTVSQALARNMEAVFARQTLDDMSLAMLVRHG